jgi:hypothetical protein
VAPRLRGDLDFAFVREVAEAAGAHNGLADGEGFVAGDVLRCGVPDRAEEVNFAASPGPDVDGDDDGSVVVVAFELGFNLGGELFRGFADDGKAANVGEFHVAGISSDEGFGFFFVFDDAEADAVANGEAIGVVERVHAIG